MNDTAAQHWKKPKEELLNKTMMEAYPGIDDTPLFAQLQRCMKERLTSEMENEFVFSDGTRCWFELRIQPVHEGIFILSIDITKRKQQEEDLRASREQLHALTSYLQSSIEEERLRISRELHDEIGQRMTALRMDLSMLKQDLSESSDEMVKNIVEREVPQMQQIIDESIQTMRQIVRDLRPEVLDTLGLIEGLRWQVEQFQQRTGINCQLTVPAGTYSFEQKLATALFRVLQEALTNVVRHAQATEVRIAMSINNKMLTLEIVDNGKGISETEIQKTESFGLLGIRERIRSLGGTVIITGERQKGTRLAVSIPYSPQ